MRRIRAAWMLLAVLGVADIVSRAFSEARNGAVSCGKTGEIYIEGVRSDAECTDTYVNVFGIWPLVQLGLVLLAPAIVAACVMRARVSVAATAAYMALIVVGVVNWADWWGQLIGPCLIASVLALIITLLHLHVRSPSYRSRAGHHRLAR
ncbi:hypothetical protein JVX90_06640 [Gordonia sp. PDNC005]|uniref:hypothetical protein n=1 Tax=Gordonia sp. PDNC005 TaxID=2811424 RepID=UPI0019656AED|nr:hypothetical protein [Gordonia sp. PDNC005]QRY63879.1 hypothetical protein JVX90_06640 [Gordonia sp. PDNC005]